MQELEKSTSVNEPACFTADLIVAMTAGVESRRSALFIADHLYWVLLQPSDELLYQTKLDQLSRGQHSLINGMPGLTPINVFSS